MTGPLADLKILDLTTTFSGPYCTQILGDLGADVIKVESPSGDISRSLGTSQVSGMASVFLGINRNKESLVLDLRAKADRDEFYRLATRADALVHNMRLSAVTKLGIDYDSLRPTCPRLLYCSITGFGSDGPYAGKPAYDDTIQGVSGLAWLQGLNSEAPTYIATAVADKTVGLTAAYAVLAGLLWRERSGQGQHVEVPMFETMASYALLEQLGGTAFRPPVGPTGYARMRSPHRRPYQTSDGYLAVAVYTERHWEAFLEFTGHTALLKDDAFATVAARNANIDRLYGLVAQELTARTTDEWLNILAKLDIPAMRINSLDDLFHDEHLNAVGFFEEVVHPDTGTLTALRVPVNYSASPVAAPAQMKPPPALGSGRAAVRRWLEEPSAPAAPSQ